MKKSFFLTTLYMISLIILFTTCKKKETQQVDNESQSVVDNAVADQEYMAVVPTTQQLAIKTKGTGAQGRELAACDTLTRISGDTLFGTTGHVDPTYTTNVGSSNCNLIMPDGKLRSGFLSIRFTNKLRIAGAKMIIKMNTYKASGIQYACDSMVVTTVTSTPLYTTFNVKLVNGICSTQAWAIKYSLDRTITNYFNGNPSGTEPYTSIFGTASGVNRSGRAFSVNIPSLNPLIKHRNCQYIDKGIMELTPDGFTTRTVDFGFGSCDDDATYSVNGNTVAFKLK